MQDFHSQPVAHYALPQLQDTAGIPGDDDLWLHSSDVRHFSVQQLLGHVSMRQVVDPCTATAPIAFWNFQELQVWHLSQHMAGLLADFLPMQEMAGIVIRRPQWYGF